MAKLVPFSAAEASEEELLLAASGKMRLPEKSLNVERLLKTQTGKVAGNEAAQAVLVLDLVIGQNPVGHHDARVEETSRSLLLSVMSWCVPGEGVRLAAGGRVLDQVRLPAQRAAT